MGGEFSIAGNRRGETKMTEEQRTLFIANFIKRLDAIDWNKWLEEEMQSMGSLKIPLDKVFYDNFHKKIEEEYNKLKDEQT